MKSEPRTGLPGAVHRLRTRAGLSQRELAEKSGLGLSRIKAIETGASTRPRSDAIKGLAMALGVEATVLLDAMSDAERERKEQLAALNIHTKRDLNLAIARHILTKSGRLPLPEGPGEAAADLAERAPDEASPRPAMAAESARPPREPGQRETAYDLLARALDAHLSGRRAAAVMFAAAYIEMIAELEDFPISIQRRRMY